MYQYTELDQQFIEQRVAQFRDQTQRFIIGKLDEETYKQLRLRNGLYVERLAPMLRVAVPYGVINSLQLRKLADIADRYDRGFAHVTTRQNFQLNWPSLEQAPDILADLASVQMHAIQTSGNCIRNLTSDSLAGVAGDEVEDPRPWCELLRQWAMLHPEFSYLPRKFKIAVSGSATDRIAAQVHDLALYLVRNQHDEIGFRILVGGGLGRTPVVGQFIIDFLPQRELLPYLEAILRIYNLHGRRDNIYKARLKILVRALGIAEFRRQVEIEWRGITFARPTTGWNPIEDVRARFKTHDYQILPDSAAPDPLNAANPEYLRWYRRNTQQHRVSGYRIVFLSLKNHGMAPGDISSDSMRQISDLADRYSMGEIRTSHTQNLILAQVRQVDLPTLWRALLKLGLARANIGLAEDIICCPGFDYCSLANATSIDVAEDILGRFDDATQLEVIGQLRINISGCVNACGHHHIGHIGLLGVDKRGEDWYQITLGGRSGSDTRLGRVLGPALPKKEIGQATKRIVETYLSQRRKNETFLQTLDRIGSGPFKEQVYAENL